jgi:hypothetical protein
VVLFSQKNDSYSSDKDFSGPYTTPALAIVLARGWTQTQQEESSPGSILTARILYRQGNM